MEELNLQEQETTTEEQQSMQQETEEQETTTEQTVQTETEQNSEQPLFFESLPDNSENTVHQMFAVLGVNLDYTPQNPYQAFTMSLQFLGAFFVVYMFLRYMFKLMSSMMSPKAW